MLWGLGFRGLGFGFGLEGEGRAQILHTWARNPTPKKCRLSLKVARALSRVVQGSYGSSQSETLNPKTPQPKAPILNPKPQIPGSLAVDAPSKLVASYAGDHPEAFSRSRPRKSGCSFLRGLGCRMVCFPLALLGSLCPLARSGCKAIGETALVSRG